MCWKWDFKSSSRNIKIERKPQNSQLNKRVGKDQTNCRLSFYLASDISLLSRKVESGGGPGACWERVTPAAKRAGSWSNIKVLCRLGLFKETRRVVMIERGCLAQGCLGWRPTHAPSLNKRTSGCDLETFVAFDTTAVPGVNKHITGVHLNFKSSGNTNHTKNRNSCTSGRHVGRSWDSAPGEFTWQPAFVFLSFLLSLSQDVVSFCFHSLAFRGSAVFHLISDVLKMYMFPAVLLMLMLSIGAQTSVPLPPVVSGASIFL